MNKKLIRMMVYIFVLVNPAVVNAVSMDILKSDADCLYMQCYSNQTVYQFKKINGKLYKRLWSVTFNRWEEPYWTPVN